MKCKFEHDGHCCNCGATQYKIECKQPCETIVTITNADRIRAMSDEELAKFIANPCECSVNPTEDGYRECGNELCKKHLLEWLKQPAG